MVGRPVSGTGDEDQTLERWLDAYEEVHQHLERVTTLRCPSCGQQSLRLLYVSFTDSAVAVMPAFWCAACLHGLPPMRAVLPDWASPVKWEEAELPDYRLIGSRSG